MLSGAGADRHGEISEFLAGCDGHRRLLVQSRYDEPQRLDECRSNVQHKPRSCNPWACLTFSIPS
jgi:hypothetical protein